MKYGLLAVVAAILIMFSSPVWALTQGEAQAIVDSTGCKAQVQMYQYPEEGFNAYYSSVGQIVTQGFEKLPESWQRHILYHEIGHCLQHKSGRMQGLRSRGPHELEWDADAYAIEKMAEEGVDGAELNAQIWAVLYQQTGSRGDDESPHGLFVERIIRGLLNRVRPHIESFK